MQHIRATAFIEHGKTTWHSTVAAHEKEFEEKQYRGLNQPSCLHTHDTNQAFISRQIIMKKRRKETASVIALAVS